MRTNVRYGNILSLVMLAVFLFIGSTYAIGIFSQQDTSVNVTGTAYADTYAGNQAMQKGFVSILPVTGWILMVVAVILIVGIIRKRR